MTNGSSDEEFGGSTRTTRPALDVLDRDQDRLLYEGDTTRDPPIQPLVDGFSSYWMVLTWYQAAAVRTLGHVERVLEPADIMPEAGVMDQLLTRTGGDGRYVRVRLVEALDDACDLAYRQFRERAQERDETADNNVESVSNIDPEAEQNPLMRPAFRKLDQEQAGALESLWVGFDNRESIGQWVRSLATPSHGNKPPGVMAEIVASTPLLEALLDQESVNAQLTRYRFAVDTVLPMYLAAARTLRGGERSMTETDSSWKQG